MNNILILLIALVTLFIVFAECFNPENMALFFLGCFTCIPAIATAITGIVLDKNFFEC